MATKPKKSVAKRSEPPPPATANPQLAEVRARIDAIDREIQALIAERADLSAIAGAR